MKAIRITQVVVLVLLGIYLWVFHNVNPDYVRLPLVPSMPPALLVLIAVVLTWLLTALPARTRLWQVKRRLAKVTEERDVLAARMAPPAAAEGAAPIIPDRIDPYDTSSGAERRGDDPTDYL